MIWLIYETKADRIPVRVLLFLLFRGFSPQISLFGVSEEQGQIRSGLQLIWPRNFGFWSTSLIRKERKGKDIFWELIPFWLTLIQFSVQSLLSALGWTTNAQAAKELAKSFLKSKENTDAWAWRKPFNLSQKERALWPRRIFQDLF